MAVELIALKATKGKVILNDTGVDSFLLPHRLTTIQRDVLLNLSIGAIIYNTSKASLEQYNGTNWNKISSGESGNKTGSTDGSGDIITTFTEIFSSSPSSIIITPRGTTPYVFNVTARTTTNFTVRVFDMAGAAVLSTAVDFDWTATK